jgi:hypothetical protein
MSDNTSTHGEGYGRNWRDIAEEMDRVESATLTTRVLADRLCRAQRAREAVDAVLDEAAGLFKHCILFRIKDTVATVWAARGWLDQTQSLTHFSASPVSANPLELLTVYPTYRGTTPIEQAYVPFFDQLGMAFPLEISLMPVEVRGRLVAILYGDNGDDVLKGNEKQEIELAKKLALGLTLVVVKNKIRGEPADA